MERRQNIQEELGKLFDALMFSGAMAQEGLPVKAPEEEAVQIQDAECPEQPESEGLYIISVAARILGMHPQTLRKYERLGLVNPCRTGGMLRLYTERDIVRLRLIRHLQDDLGLNLAGVEVALTMLRHLMALHQRVEAQADFGQLRRTIEQELGSLLDSLGLSADEP